MIHIGDAVEWDAQGTIPAGNGILLAIARGSFPGSAGLVHAENKRSYIVRSNEWQSDEFWQAFEDGAVATADSPPYAQLMSKFVPFNRQEDRKLLWLVDIRPRDWDA